MGLARITLSLAGIIGIVTTTMALATLWLLMTEPVTVADAVARGDVTPVVSGILSVLGGAIQSLLDYL